MAKAATKTRARKRVPRSEAKKAEKSRASSRSTKKATTRKATTRKAAAKPSTNGHVPDVKLTLEGKVVFDGSVSDLFAMMDGKQDGPSIKQRMILSCLNKVKSGMTCEEISEKTGMLSSTVGLICKSDKYNGLLSQKLVTVDDVEPQEGESGKQEVIKITAKGSKVL